MKKLVVFFMLFTTIFLSVESYPKEIEGVVTLQNDASITVKHIRILYIAPGIYAGPDNPSPIRIHDTLYYQIELNNVSFQKDIHISKIKSIVTKIKDNLLEEVEITLKTREKVIMKKATGEIIEISTNGESDVYKMIEGRFFIWKPGKSHWWGGWIVGRGLIDGQEGYFNARLKEIKKIEFK